jgi:MinD superfamily P-loop ATPase
MLGIIAQTGSPAGVIINRQGIGDNHVEEFLEQTTTPILMKIPYQREIAEGLAAGQILTDFSPRYRSEFINLYERIKRDVQSTKQEKHPQ